MPVFIEIVGHFTKQRIWINPHEIVSIKIDDEGRTIIDTKTGFYYTDETPELLMKKISAVWR